MNSEIGNNRIRKAKKIKIIVDTEDYVLRWLPAISIRFIKGISRFGFGIFLSGLRNSKKEEDRKKYEALKNISKKDLDLIFEELMYHEPFEIVNVHAEKDNTYVRIYTI
jgi:hypothetical protein